MKHVTPDAPRTLSEKPFPVDRGTPAYLLRTPDDQQIKQALKDMDEVLHFSDLGYYIRDRIDYSEYEGNSWEHPTIKKYSAAYDVLKKLGLVK